jgi:tetratricopeptide (TPR) repeat protein
MRNQLLLGSTFAATLAVAAFGFADPQAGKAGTSSGVSLGGSAAPPSPPGARPANSASVGVSASAGATTPAGSAATSTRADGKSRAGARPSSSAIAKGHGAYMARDYPGAIQAYKEAIAQDGSDPANYYLLGEAQIAGGNTADADASFAAGLRNAGGKDDLHAKLLFVIADLRERQGKWSEAKKAWEDYAQFLSTHPGVKGYQATATDRVKVVDARADLDTKYAPVRQRIEQRVKENAAGPPAADETPPPAPGPAKKK